MHWHFILPVFLVQVDVSYVVLSFFNFYLLAKFSILLNILVDLIPTVEDSQGWEFFLSDSCSLKFLQTIQEKHIYQLELSKHALWLS